MPASLRRLLLPIAILTTLPLLAACVRTASPEGWTPPTELAAGQWLISLKKGTISSVILEDPSSARVEWTFPSGDDPATKDLDPQGIYPEPIITEDAILVATLNEGLFALDPSTGSPLWQRRDLRGNIVDAFAATPSGLVAVGTVDGNLYLLDPANGLAAPGWPPEGISLEDGIWASIAVDDTSLYVATMRGHVFAIDQATAGPSWPAPFRASGAILDLALLPNGELFVPSLDGNVYLVDSADGSERARVPTDHWVWMQPAVGGNTAFFGDLGGTVYAIDITTGSLRWSQPPDPNDNLAPFERIKARPALVEGKLIIADRAPAVHFLDPDTGSRLNRVPLDAKTVRAAVVPAGSVALIVSTNGRLFRANPADLSVVQIPLSGTP